MPERCIILARRSYDFEDAKDKRRVTGMTLHYLEDFTVNDTDQAGCFPMSISCPPELKPALVELPGVYDLTFSRKPGKGGKPITSLAGVKFIKKFPLTLSQ